MHPQVAVVRVGQNEADITYERTLTKKADALGIKVNAIHLQENVSQSMLLSTIEVVNADQKVHGCLVFRPLPADIDELKICNMIAPKKDIDGVGADSLASVFMGAVGGFAPATAEACVELLTHYDIEVKGKHVVVVGRSLVVGKPLSMLLLDRDATVTLCHSKTPDLANMMQSGDIVVCAVGRPREFGAKHFRSGQVVLDVGANVDSNGVFCGDVDYASVEPIVAAITPVPGGIGSITSSIILRHVVQAAECSLSY